MFGGMFRKGAAGASQKTGMQSKAVVARTSPARPKSAMQAAQCFLAWLYEHDLCREWAVDDVWYLAESDFAEGLDVDLPPRRVFLGALKKLEGVQVTQDRRIYNRAGQAVRKTTFYSFMVVPTKIVRRQASPA